MIDFRYHLVSLVSVFLALAVGIVLGAGPLKESIGDTLTDQVARLREDNAAKGAELATAKTALTHRDDFTEALSGTLQRGQLTGRSVVMVTLPDVQGDDVDPLTDAVRTAGGTVTGTIEVAAGWSDPAQAAARADLVTGLLEELPEGTVAASKDPEVNLAALAARALVSDAQPAVGRSDATATAILDGLEGADLLKVDGDLAGLASVAVVVAPAVPEATGKAAATKDPGTAKGYLPLAAALDRAGAGAVVTGPASAATARGVVSAVRGDDAVNSRVSTVDTGSTPMGPITTVLALREQVLGDRGSYGFGDGAKDPLPEFAPPVAGVAGAGG